MYSGKEFFTSYNLPKRWTVNIKTFTEWQYYCTIVLFCGIILNAMGCSIKYRVEESGPQ